MSDMLTNIFDTIDAHITIIRLLITLIITLIIFSLILRTARKYLLKMVKTKKMVSNVTVFLDILKYFFVLFLVIIVIFSYYGNWSELGFFAGLLTVALGFALQKPIVGVVAWLIIIIRRPFSIGDRISVLDAKGDVTNISLTHIFLDEIGGTIEGEESSGRIVMIPNSILFEKEIINYTHQNDYILDEVVTAITYESNLEKAEDIMRNAVLKIMEPLWKNSHEKISTKVHIRLLFKDSGIDIIVRYNTNAINRGEIATNIRREIFNQIRKTEDVEIAYPHREILIKEKR